jgi:hypothetical protein
MTGYEIGQVLNDLYAFFDKTRCDKAKTDADLDDAAKDLAGAFAKGGVAGVMAILTGLMGKAGGKIAKKVKIKPKLKFGEDDLVYGPSAGGKLNALKKDAGGGKLLDEAYGNPYDNKFGKSFSNSDDPWAELSKHALDDAASKGKQVHFDLSHMDDLDNVLAGKGPHADRVTSKEIRHIRDNWDNFQVKPKFYKNGVEVPPPWSKK